MLAYSMVMGRIWRAGGEVDEVSVEAEPAAVQRYTLLNASRRFCFALAMRPTSVAIVVASTAGEDAGLWSEWPLRPIVSVTSGARGSMGVNCVGDTQSDRPPCPGEDLSSH